MTYECKDGQVMTDHDIRVKCSQILRQAKKDLTLSIHHAMMWAGYEIGRFVTLLPCEAISTPLSCMSALRRLAHK